MKSKKLKDSAFIKMQKQPGDIYARVRKIIENARGNIERSINTEMVITY